MRGLPVDELTGFAGSFFWKRLFVKGPTVHTANNSAVRAGDATGSVGRSHSSDEVSVMEMERRALVIQSQYF